MEEKTAKTDERPSDEALFAHRTAHVHDHGDKRTELVHWLMLVSMEAEKIRIAMENTVENYSDGLSDLNMNLVIYLKHRWLLKSQALSV